MIYFQKTDFRSKLNDLQRREIRRCFAYCFFRTRLNNFRNRNPLYFWIKTFFWMFYFKKSGLQTLKRNKIPLFFLTFFFPYKTSVWRALEFQRLDSSDPRKIKASEYCASEIKGRKVGRKAIFQSPKLPNFKATKLRKSFFLKAVFGEPQFPSLGKKGVCKSFREKQENPDSSEPWSHIFQRQSSTKNLLDK